jgi:hypothetical protein
MNAYGRNKDVTKVRKLMHKSSDKAPHLALQYAVVYFTLPSRTTRISRKAFIDLNCAIRRPGRIIHR